ncbi:MAG: hypothetical protein M3N68_00535 [Actinomycetota bacterium]|nr:hypothetical protein [Actinomycetota bacterium]
MKLWETETSRLPLTRSRSKPASDGGEEASSSGPQESGQPDGTKIDADP